MAASDPATFNPRPFWTAAQLGDYLGISRAAAYRLLDSGEIAWNQFGTSRRIPIQAVAEYIQKTAKGSAAAVSE